MAGLALALRFVPYSDDHGHFDAALDRGDRRLRPARARRQRLPGLTCWRSSSCAAAARAVEPGTPGGSVDEGVARELETGSFAPSTPRRGVCGGRARLTRQRLSRVQRLEASSAISRPPSLAPARQLLALPERVSARPPIVAATATLRRLSNEVVPRPSRARLCDNAGSSAAFGYSRARAPPALARKDGAPLSMSRSQR